MRSTRAALVVLAALLVAGTAGAGNRVVVKSSKNAALGETILANMKGATLYRLSGEKKGALRCTSSACLAAWHPLWVPAGTTPAGAKHLGTLARGGRLQVTYAGGPLYTFAGDTKRGQANGNGLTTGSGTWALVVLSGGGSSPAPSPPPAYGPPPGYG